ncbi:cellulase [Sulfolobus tengchongensis]|uniref:Cellulase n=1 Tax=Sulfolobus tengchongensis TaxID=207809 RepID=A0AAX4L1F6_9CREN
MNRRIILIVIVIVIVISSLFAVLYHGGGSSSIIHKKEYNNNYQIYTLFPGPNSRFNLIANYSSNTAYALALINSSSNATLMASPFLWNIGYALGNVNMSFYHNMLHVAINLTNIQKISSNDVDGYPGLMYGQELWFPFYYHTKQLEQLPLPMIISKLPNFYSVLNFSVYNITGRIIDFSYDIWLSQNPNITSLQYGDFEVMIWMYWTKNLTGVPYFIYTGNISIPTLVNGTIENLTWEVYVLPRTGSANGWTGIYFLSPKKLQGEIGVPIAYVLTNMNPFLEKAGVNIYNPNEYYLDAIQVGMEFTNTTQGNVNVGYNLYSWQIYIVENNSVFRS